MQALIIWMQNWGALVISAISLLLAVLSLIQSGQAQSIQNKVNQLELQIKENELERIKKEQEQSLSSCVQARVIHIGKGKYRLKVWNSGSTTVMNVSAKIEDENGPIIIDMEKQPYDELEPNKSYELVLIVHSGTVAKFRIKTEWTDTNGNQQSKTQMGDI